MALVVLLVVGAWAKKATSPPKSSPVEAVGYPRGPWWRGDINQTLLGVSHILVSYKGAARQDELLTILGPAPERSRDDALTLAKGLRAELVEHPDRFEALAKERSDDPATAPLGGMIGEVFAPHLPDAMVDALGNLRPGEISRVVETRIGFDVIKRVAVRPELTVDGSQIVIGYVGSSTNLRGGRTLTRTREQARALAEQLRAEAAQDPGAFADLARTHSDAFEGDRGGDIGQWSTQARSGEATPLYVLSSLAVGQVSHVLETPEGFRILKRDARKERESYAVAALVVAYANRNMPKAPPREQARASAQAILDVARQHPDRFDALRQQHCDYDMCSQRAQSFKDGYWIFSGIIEAIRKVNVGEIVDEVLDTPLGYAVLRREDPTVYPVPTPSAVNYELPRPEMPGLQSASTSDLLWYVGELRQKVHEEMPLDPKVAAGLTAVFDRLANGYASLPPDEREKFTAEINLEFATVLGPAKASQLTEINARLMRSVSGETLAGR